MSTNLNNKIDCYGRLADRIKRSLGWPMVSIEVHQDGIFESIQMAVEMFTTFAGYTQEYLVFDSNLYERNRGIRLDSLFSIANSPQLTEQQRATGVTQSPIVSHYNTQPSTVFVSTSSLPPTFFSSSSSLSAIFTEGIFCYQVLDCDLYHQVTTFSPVLTSYFQSSRPTGITMQCDTPDGSVSSDECAGECGAKYQNMFDYDVLDYRKVVAVRDFNEGSSTSVDTLFSIEQHLAQQTYFSFSMANRGFDMVTWYTMKEWIECREKMLATKRSFTFDERTQYLKMYPQPDTNSRFYGVIDCYVERPIRDVIKEQWVQQYATALVKIQIGRIRGRFQGVSLLGGGSFNYDILEEGRAEKEQLERELKEGASAGWSAEPIMFFVG